MSLDLNPKHYDHPFPYFAQPEIISEYSVDKDRNVQLGRSDAAYLIPFREYQEVCYDLNAGRESLVEKDGQPERLDVLLKWACTQAPEGSCTAKKVFHEADIVCWRGLLTRIAATPVSSNTGWRFVAQRVGGMLFLCEYETEEAKMRKENATQRDKQMTYWGHKFERYVTTKQIGGTYDVNAVVDLREEFAVVVKGKIGVHGVPGGSLKLAYGAEVDGITQDSGKLVEVKTQLRALEGNFWKDKSCKWWIQSFLVGLDRIIVGYRDDNGIVNSIGSVDLNLLTKSGHWRGNVCMNFLGAVLGTLQRRLPNTFPPYSTVHVQYDPNTRRVHFDNAPKHEADFIPAEFIRHFRLPERPSV